jgi:hypothetical protein
MIIEKFHNSNNAFKDEQKKHDLLDRLFRSSDPQNCFFRLAPLEIPGCKLYFILQSAKSFPYKFHLFFQLMITNLKRKQGLFINGCHKQQFSSPVARVFHTSGCICNESRVAHKIIIMLQTKDDRSLMGTDRKFDYPRSYLDFHRPLLKKILKKWEGA